MKAINQFGGVVLLLLALGCSGTEPSPNTYGLTGNWRFYEEGSSPGFGYIITPIPAVPLQKLTFLSNGRVQKQGDKLTGFFNSPYYRVDSSATAGRRLYFMTDPKADLTKLNGLFFQIKGDTLRISPQCFEGCHYGFVRIR
jgi:hypothetical protein